MTAPERFTVTLPSGSVGTIDARRYAYLGADDWRVDIWARRPAEADAGAEAYSRAIGTTLRPIATAGAREADDTISAGVVWEFGTPDREAIRHRLGLNVLVDYDRQRADILEERRQLGVPSSVPMPYPFDEEARPDVQT